MRLIGGVLPPGVPDAARTIALALGLGMIFFSRGLARRKRRAWYLAVAIVIASALAHLAKGLDFEEATVHLLLLVALLPGAPPVRRAGRSGDGAAARPGRRSRCSSPACSSLVVMVKTDNVSDADRGGGPAARRRARIPCALALAAAAAGRAAVRRGSRAGDRARPGARDGQPRLLRAAPGQELLLRAERQVVPRLPRDRQHGARRRRPDRRGAASGAS